MAADTPKTLIEAIRHYSDLDRCQKELAAARWVDGQPQCPTCGRVDVSYLANQKRWQCKTKHPKRQFSVKVGTIFEDSPIGLDKWFAAIWMVANCKNGISSYEVARDLGVTQKTAWFMLHRIRLAMQTGTFMRFDGNVEVDETYIGGKARNMHKGRRARAFGGNTSARKLAGKVAVMGLLERHGDGASRVITRVISGTKRKDLVPHIVNHVEYGANVYSDALQSYNELGREYVHSVIDHAEKYVDGQVHTNGLENYWSLLKRALKGTYVSVEPFHLFRYIDEQTYRFNNRKATDTSRFTGVLRSVIGRRVTYNELIAAERPA